jgi:hypothetical protein
MGSDALRELFQQKKQKAAAAGPDWTAKRDAWTDAVHRLYKKILEEYLSTVKDVEVQQAEKTITENYIGEYRVPELTLRVGDEQVVFSPIGVNIVGAKGRMDVQGDRGDATIVWEDGDRWSVVLSRVPALRLEPLTAESLAEILRGIMRP